MACLPACVRACVRPDQTQSQAQPSTPALTCKHSLYVSRIWWPFVAIWRRSTRPLAGRHWKLSRPTTSILAARQRKQYRVVCISHSRAPGCLLGCCARQLSQHSHASASLHTVTGPQRILDCITSSGHAVMLFNLYPTPGFAGPCQVMASLPPTPPRRRSYMAAADPGRM